MDEKSVDNDNEDGERVVDIFNQIKPILYQGERYLIGKTYIDLRLADNQQAIVIRGIFTLRMYLRKGHT